MNYLATKTYRPVSVLNDMDRFINQMFEGSAKNPQRSFSVDIVQSEDGYRLEAEMPGYSIDEVDVRVEENLLVIEGKRQESTENKTDEKLTWLVRERQAGNLKRSFVLPDDIDKSGVEASLTNGLLVIGLKKKPEAKPFQVKIKGK